MRIRLEDCSPDLKKRIEDAIKKQAASDRTPVSVADMESCTSHEPLDKGANAYFATQVDISIHSIRTRLADADGICHKYVIDQLVNSKVLEDDSPRWVRQVTFSQEKGEPEKTIITITEV